MKKLAIIPARFASSRFPGKPLATIGGTAMLQHVHDRVKSSNLFDKVIIATEDNRIFEAAQSWNAEVLMTSDKHISGTDRCAEVVSKLNENFDIIINVQGDEPFISEQALRQVVSIFDNASVEIGTLVQRIENETEINNPNIVKAVLSTSKQALYFSRSKVPYLRNAEANFIYWKHIGIYGYRKKILQEIVELSPSSLELAESLEQLRWLENGYKIYTEETDYKMIAVDTPEDLEKAENFYNTIIVQK